MVFEEYIDYDCDYFESDLLLLKNLISVQYDDDHLMKKIK